MADDRFAGSRVAPTGTAGLRPVPADGRGWHSRRYLPHFDKPGLIQMVTFRLADSLPAEVVEETARIVQGDPKRRARIEAFLDAGRGSCWLRDPHIATLVQDAMLHFDGQRYHLLAWVIMPNHVHVLVETGPGHSLSSIIWSWKSYTAKAANKLLGRTGTFWWPDYFDRAIRDERHLDNAVEYIENNPVKVGLARDAAGWPHGSAACARPTVGRTRGPVRQDKPARCCEWKSRTVKG